MFDNLLLAELPSLTEWVWADYRLAVLLTVVIPLVLIVWAFVRRAEMIQQLLTIYWRVASLLAITVYLMIAALPISFVSALASRILIPISLWFWVDLNEELNEMQPSLLKTAFLSWRWAVTLYNVVGAILFVPSVRCAFLSRPELIEQESCRIWLDPPWRFREIFHANLTPQFLGFLAVVGLVIYLLCLLYFVLVKLRRQGRSATGY
ncbi:MAG: DUF3177 family protein [Microcoleaceae cyanobacterium]